MTNDNEIFDYQLNLSEAELTFIQKSREVVQAILRGEDRRLLVLVGPCSIHDVDAAIDYGIKLKKLSKTLSDRLYCVMRCYVEKPRTTLGWKGLLYDPHLDGSYAMEIGVRKTRELLKALTAMSLPLGSEVLELTTAPFYTDFLSWGCIGARTSASPPHRQMASGLPFPIGFKNSVDGNIDTAVQGLIAAREPHIFLGPCRDGRLRRIETTGNKDCHIVLRGSEKCPNYYPEDVAHAVYKARKAGVGDSIMIDCSHDNSFKQYKRQPEVFEAIIHQIEEGCGQIRGVMLESFLEEGSQPIGKGLRYGVSVTDSCVSWETTKRLLERAHQVLSPTTVSLCLC